ncbi:hypothetical protein ABZ863_17035 [Saccharomonospora sp. NPDC046836]|uniref:hypothetical protein n=1 Tax=Saccharomonospora sp. NPDC046836 TaxID=3156921 RepID=UPI00340A3ED7
MSPFEYRSRRLLFHRSAAAEEQVAGYAASFGWPRTEVPADEEAGIPREVVWAIASTVDVRYSVDDATGSPYVFVTAAYRNQCQAFLAHAEQHLDVFSREELLAVYGQAVEVDERTGLLLMVALGAPQEFDETNVALISAALTDPAEDVREAAIYATSYTPCERYLPLLEQIVRQDPPHQLREDAKDILAAYGEVGIR